MLQFFSLGPKQYFYLTPSSREYFEKLAFKRKNKHNLKRLYLKSWDEFRVNTNILRKFIQFSLKEKGFLHGSELRPLQHPVQMRAARRAKRVIDEPVKVLNLLFLSISFSN